MKNEQNNEIMNQRRRKLKEENKWVKKEITKEYLLTADPNELNGDERVMRGILKQNPDLTLEELREALDELP